MCSYQCIELTLRVDTQAVIDAEFDYGIVIEDSKMGESLAKHVEFSLLNPASDTPVTETKTFVFTTRIHIGTVKSRTLRTVASSVISQTSKQASTVQPGADEPVA